jgi:hypothetical protein
MKIMFIDESKKQDSGKIKEAFILLGLMIDSKKIIEIETEIDEIKERYGIQKIEDIRKIKEKEARLALTVEIRDKLLEKDCRILSSIYGEVALSNYKKIEEVYPDCFDFILERFFMNLNMKSPKEDGLIIHDEFGKPYGQSFIRESYKKIKNESFSPCWTKIKTPYKERIYPQIFFGKDDYSNLLQLSDIIVSSLNFAYRKLKEGVEYEKLGSLKSKLEELREQNDYLNLYWDLFVKNPKNGEASNYGIKLWV